MVIFSMEVKNHDKTGAEDAAGAGRKLAGGQNRMLSLGSLLLLGTVARHRVGGVHANEVGCGGKLPGRQRCGWLSGYLT